MVKKVFLGILFVLLLLFAAKQNKPALIVVPSPTPTSTIVPFTRYQTPNIPKKSMYLMVMVGDSMTLALGPHGGLLNQILNQKYKTKNIFVDIDNYAQGSTNIFSFDSVFSTPTKSFDLTFPSLRSVHFDVILIESFGYNPLSQFSRAEGLKQQTKKLDDIMTTLMYTHPDAAVVFVATIAPNKQNYARPVLPYLSVSDRTLEAEERMAYIQNHISYAIEHNIPVIDIFDTSTVAGDGNLAYINPDDYIHPSEKGIELISTEIANFIWDHQILPY